MAERVVSSGPRPPSRKWSEIRRMEGAPGYGSPEHEADRARFAVEVDEARLRELANAATPGPWRATFHGDKDHSWSIDSDALRDLFYGEDSGAGSENTRDVAYIAAASPDVVLGFLDRLERWPRAYAEDVAFLRQTIEDLKAESAAERADRERLQVERDLLLESLGAEPAE